MTVIILRLFHHGPSPVPWKLRQIVFKMIASMIFFDVKLYERFGKISEVSPRKQSVSKNENGQQNMELDFVENKEKANMEVPLELLKLLKKIEINEEERHIKEWQTIAKILDRLLLILNILSIIISFGYGYTKLYIS